MPAMPITIEAAAVTPTQVAGLAHIYRGNQRIMAISAPHVPGATGRNPAPSEVAIRRGRRGNRFVEPSGSLVDLRYGFAMAQEFFRCCLISLVTSFAM